MVFYSVRNLQVSFLEAAIHNRNTYSTVNDNEIELRSENCSAGRSKSVNAIYMEEVDAMKDFNFVFSCLSPCMISMTDTKFLISSTPISSNSYFNYLWNNPNNRFDKIEVSHSKIKTFTNKKTLNDISRTAYSKIIREVAI